MSMFGGARVAVSLFSVGWSLVCVPGDVTGQVEPPRPERGDGAGDGGAGAQGWCLEEGYGPDRRSDGAADDVTPFVWFTGGLGASNGMAWTLAGSLQRRRSVFSVRVADTWEGGVVDVGLLYGRAAAAGPIHLSLSGGLGPVFGRRVRTTVGIPLEAQASLRKGIFGLGAYGFGNVNSEESMLGVTIAFQLGRFPRS